MGRQTLRIIRHEKTKNFFSRVFFRTPVVNCILYKNVYFVVGEKGTGKTAFAVHLSSGFYKKTFSFHKFVHETDYRRFVSLKKNNQLSISAYSDIWKVLILALMAHHILEKGKFSERVINLGKYKSLKKALNEYHIRGFNPEIPAALQLVEGHETTLKILLKYLGSGIEDQDKRIETLQINESTMQLSLARIEAGLRKAISEIKLSENHILFVDGIDVRPSDVGYEEYLECVRGLVTATWALNTDFFNTIRDSHGRLKIITLIRPDVFEQSGLNNKNAKLHDNSVILDWTTDRNSYLNSDLFAVADRMLSVQQESREEGSLVLGQAWSHYLPISSIPSGLTATKPTDSFLYLLENSFHRPRDILTALNILKRTSHKFQDKSSFTKRDL